MRLEGRQRPLPHRLHSRPILRDASLRDAPQDDVEQVESYCSGLMPVCFTTPAYFSLSFLMKPSNCATDIGTMSAPAASIFALMSGCASTSLIALLSVATICGGVPCGAKKPAHKLKSKSLMWAASATVGTSGAVEARRAVETASIFICPVFTNGTAAGKPGK